MAKMLYIAPYCFGLEESLAASFARQGCELRKIIYDLPQAERSWLQQRLFNWKGYGLIGDLRKVAARFGVLDHLVRHRLRAFNQGILQAFEEAKPEIVFIVKGDTILPETLAQMKKSAPMVAYYWDDPFLRFAQSMSGVGDVRHRNLVKNAPAYDYTFVYDPSYVPELEKLGAKNVSYLMDWYEPELYRPIELSAEEKARYGADVSFVGSPYENRVELLDKLRDFRVGIWGPLFRWKQFFASHPFIEKSYRGEAHGSDSARIYNASKISLNIHDTVQCKESVNNRTFQIMACGSFELVDDRPKLLELFEVGQELDSFLDGEDLVQKVHRYLKDDSLREGIAKRSREKSRLHSADVRVKQILEEISRV